MTEPTLSERLRARADYLSTVSGDPPVQLPDPLLQAAAENPELLLRAAANTLDYLAPFQEALRLLGFGGEHCTSTDPIDYAKRWLAERLREDKARAEAERRLEETMTELNRICGLSFARISLAEAPRREEVEARLRRCGIEPDADLTGSVTLLLDKLEAAQHTNASLDLALRKRQATVDRQGNELGVLRTERKVCSSLGIELDNTLAIDDAVVATVAHRELAWRLQQAELKVRSHELNCPRPGASIEVSPKSDLFQEAAEKLGRELARRVDAMLAGLGPGQRLAVGEVVFPGGLSSEVAMRVLDPGEAPPLGQRWTVYGPVTPKLPACDGHLGEAEIDGTVVTLPVIEDIDLDGTLTWGEVQIVVAPEDRAKVDSTVLAAPQGSEKPVTGQRGPWDCPTCGQLNGPVTDDCKGFTCTGCGHMYSVGT